MPQNKYDERKAEMAAITAKIEQGVQELFNSEKYKAYLNTMSKFYNYSHNNIILIALQKPDASHVAGYQSWQRNFERHVKKGEKGIRILAPSPYKITVELKDSQGHTAIGQDGKPETKEVTIPAFKMVTVFDVSQTEGKELPAIANELSGNIKNFTLFMEAIKEISPVPIEYGNISSGAKGYFSSSEQKIVLRDGMGELQTVKTAIHELAHSNLHNTNANPDLKKNQRTREVEAESVAFTVCRYFGLDTSEYSFDYIASWSSGKELSELKGSLETIRNAAAEIINDIEGHFMESQKSRTELLTIKNKPRDSIREKLSSNKKIVEHQKRTSPIMAERNERRSYR